MSIKFRIIFLSRMARPIPERSSFDNGLNEMKGICFFFFSVLLARSFFPGCHSVEKWRTMTPGVGYFWGASFINFMGSARGVAFFVGVLASKLWQRSSGRKIEFAEN